MRKTLLLSLILFMATAAVKAQVELPLNNYPKREFRGAWIQAVNGQFQGMGRDKMQQNLTNQLNKLAQCHVNTIIFQVRVEADALYESSYEPWSRYLTGQQGKAPEPYWDPLAWMVEQCHQRGMEIHAWINPYRAKTKGTTELSAKHPYVQNPERFFSYDGLLLFDPGLPDNRQYICKIAADITRRYDIDGLHIDDYFYPYPVSGLSIPDDNTYRSYKNAINNKDDWRRYNVNLLIKELHETIHRVKPWVKFGVSPFGIYHNAQEGSPIVGSKTSGLQNYDQLYADVLLWVNNGWVDYNVPQIYWEIGHKAADYDELIHWWSRYCSRRPLVIGQDVERTVRAADLRNPSQNQMPEKFRLQRTLPGIAGSCLCSTPANLSDHTGAATIHALHRLKSPKESAQPQGHLDARRILSLLDRAKRKVRDGQSQAIRCISFQEQARSKEPERSAPHRKYYPAKLHQTALRRRAHTLLLRSHSHRPPAKRIEGSHKTSETLSRAATDYQK